MAGPGGGPPRKSHTKSRKGCKTCKKRHIRCDESFPQCRNCTKHNCRCDYMDVPAAGDEPLQGSPPDLLMTPELQHDMDQWRISGESPIPELRMASPQYWTQFSTMDLRLVHHIASLSIDLHRRGYSACTAWASKMPILIAVSLQSDLVMSALLALSASHLAWQTKDVETENLSYHHRGIALKSLHEAIGAFSRDNSEAILAASMLLSWQATEWRSWASLQQGVSTILNAMRPWLHDSELATYIEGQRAMLNARTPMTPTLPGSPSHVHPEELGRLDRATTALRSLRLRLANNPELLAEVEELLEYVVQLQQDFPLQVPEQAFERLQALRAWLFWLPPSMFRPGESDVGAMAVMSHFYAVALALEPLFPEIGGAYLGSLSVAPIEEMQNLLWSRSGSNAQEPGLQVAMSLMEFPMQMATAYKMRQRQYSQSMDTYRANSRSPYPMPPPPLVSTPDLPSATLYSNSPVLGSASSRPAEPSYFHPTSSSSTSRREMGNHRTQAMGERTASTGSPLSQTHMAYSQRGMEYYAGAAAEMRGQEAAAFTSYGANTREESTAATSSSIDSHIQGKGKSKE